MRVKIVTNVSEDYSRMTVCNYDHGVEETNRFAFGMLHIGNFWLSFCM